MNAIVEIKCYDDLHRALRDRAEEVNISRLTIDDIAGLTPGHSSKILGPTQSKRLGPMSFGPMLQTLGVKMLLVEDPETMARYAERRVPRCPSRVKKP